MIHYHGTPITPESDCARILAGRHAMVSYLTGSQVGTVAEVCESFTFDNSAFIAWKNEHAIDWANYYLWVEQWMRHPGFDWAIIPDVIDGDESQNDVLIMQWPHGCSGVPVWHLHESLGRLERLASEWPRVALGSSGVYAQIGTPQWWNRMCQVMRTVTKEGKPITKLHGLRMLDTDVFTRFPFASADSTNVARNIGLDSRWKGTYQPPSKAARGVVLAERIEAHQSAATWADRAVQETLLFTLESELGTYGTPHQNPNSDNLVSYHERQRTPPLTEPNSDPQDPQSRTAGDRGWDHDSIPSHGRIDEPTLPSQP